MLYPLRFEPVFRRYLWGGRRLGTVLGKPIGSGDDFAESWEVVDRHDAQSIVRFGPLAGTSLRQLVTDAPDELLGPHRGCERFPLLFKFLDAHRTLSVQVHPDDRRAARLNPPDFGKTEAWVILDAQPDSRIFAGLRPGCRRADLARALAEGSVEQCLHAFIPAVGDCVFMPAGVVHALGAGLLVAEIQQASDATYRLFDWNRVEADGQPRALHVEEALEAIDYDRGPISPQQAEPTTWQGRQRLVTCDKFLVDRHELAGPVTLPPDRRARLLVVLAGTMQVSHDPAPIPCVKGDTLLLPASLGEVSVVPRDHGVLLDICLP